MKRTRLSRSGFTLVELMLVVVIVAILSLVAVPLYEGHVKTSYMTEGISGVGMIRTCFRVYAAAHDGQYPVLAGVDGTGLQALDCDAGDLAGKHFTAADYAVTSTANSYTIRATLPADNAFWYEVDEAGNEQKGGF